MINGNHDHSNRLSFGHNLFAQLNFHIISKYNDRLYKFSKDNVDIYLLPFLMQADVRKKMEAEGFTCNSSNDIVSWILSKEKLDKNKTNIILVHQFVSKVKGEDIELSDSESGLFVGPLDLVDASLFKDFDYVALGHIHRFQEIEKERIVYSGTPMKYSFSEVYKKTGEKIESGVVIYETEKDKGSKIKRETFEQLRPLRIITDLFKDVMKLADSDEIIRVELKDSNRIDDAYNKLIVKFPNMIDLVYINEKKTEKLSTSTIGATSVEGKSEFDIVSEFIKMHTNEDLSEEENNIIKNVIEEIKEVI